MAEKAETKRGMGRRLLRQAPLLVSLVVLWMLLWGEITWLSAVSGLAVALGVTRLLYLPPVELGGRFNLFWFLVLALRFLSDIVVSSVLVAAEVLRPGRTPLNAIVQVPLRTRSDFVLSVTATIVSLVPGTLVLEIDRDRGQLFVHVLAARDAGGVETARRSVLATEASVIRAFGSRADLERVRS